MKSRGIVRVRMIAPLLWAAVVQAAAQGKVGFGIVFGDPRDLRGITEE